MGSRMGRPATRVEFSGDERAELEGMLWCHSMSQGLAMRCRIVLLAASGCANTEIAEEVGCTTKTVSKWRKRFAVDGLSGLSDAARSGRPRGIGDEQIKQVITQTLETTPKGATHWSTRLMAEHIGVSNASVHRIWRAFGLQPHRTEDFKISSDPFFVEKVRDITGLYLNPPEAAVVLCADEKTQVQALDRTSPILPLLPGVPQRRTHDYKRYGTTNLYTALDIASGKVITATTKRHRAEEFRRFLNLIDKNTPRGVEVHIILDNYGTHKSPIIRKWLRQHPRFTFHFTPTYSSWMNLVERWFAELTIKHLQRQTHRSVKELTDSLNEWINTWNENPRPFIWHKTANQIFNNLKSHPQLLPNNPPPNPHQQTNTTSETEH